MVTGRGESYGASERLLTHFQSSHVVQKHSLSYIDNSVQFLLLSLLVAQNKYLIFLRTRLKKLFF